MAGLFASSPQTQNSGGGWFAMPADNTWPGTDAPPASSAPARVNVNNSTSLPRTSSSRGPDYGVKVSKAERKMLSNPQFVPGEDEQAAMIRESLTNDEIAYNLGLR